MSKALEDKQPGFDKEALRRKYREERDKRLRADGIAQYVEIDDQLSQNLEDLGTDPFPASTARLGRRLS